MSCSLLRKVHATIPRLIQFDATQPTSLFGILVTFQSYVNMQLILSMKSVENIVTLSFYVNTDLSSVSHLTEISIFISDLTLIFFCIFFFATSIAEMTKSTEFISTKLFYKKIKAVLWKKNPNHISMLWHIWRMA